MWYRRNMDSRLRELERRYKVSGSIEDRDRFIKERLRMGLGGLRENIIEILDSHAERIQYQDINIHQSEEQFQHLLELQGDDPNYQVENSFLTYEVERNPNSSITPDELETTYDAISEVCNLLGWPTLLDRLHMPFSNDDHNNDGYGARQNISYFLERSSHRSFDFRALSTHQAIIDLFNPEELEKRYERPLDEYELEDAAEHEATLHQELDRGRLNRKLYIVNPDLLQITGSIRHRPPSSGKLLANHLGRYETFLHFVLVEFPPGRHDFSPKYVTWHYNIQQGGFGGGNYDMKYEHAVEDYLRRILKVS